MKDHTRYAGSGIRLTLLLIALGCLLAGGLASAIFQPTSAAQDDSLRLNPKPGHPRASTPEGNPKHVLQPLTDEPGERFSAPPYPTGHVIESENGQSVCRDATEEEARAMLQRNPEQQLRVINDEESSALSPVQSQEGMKITLRGTPQLEQNPAAKAAFLRAAQRWVAVIQTPITVVIDVDFGPTRFGTPYPPNVLGSTNEQEIGSNTNYPGVRSALIGRASNAQEAALYNSLPQAQLPTDIGATTRVSGPSAVFRALGRINPVADPDGESQQLGPPPSVGFNSAFQFDFDPSDGIEPGKTDFDATAVHEIGHALGFTSNAGLKELVPSAPVGSTPWDLFRFRPGVTGGTFSTAQRILSSGGEQVFFDGGPELALSTGRPNGNGGDGRQSSHWKDDEMTGRYIGIMDPTIPRGKREEITENDLKALDLMGYQLKSGPNPNPTPTPTPQPGGDTVALTSGVPQTGSIPAPAQGSAVLGPTQYTIQVPGGATQLKVDLSGNPDIDLYVRFGNRIVVQNGGPAADFKSESETGNESITVTPGSSPALQAGTYYIAVGNFGPGAANFSLTARVTGGGPTPTPTPTPQPGGDTVALTSGAPQTGSIPAPAQGSAILGPTQYTIQVPSGATQLKVDLSGNPDVDLYARFGNRIVVQNGGPAADFKSESETGNESITVTPGSSPALQAGVYYIAVGNFGPGAANFSLTATVSGGGSGSCNFAISPTNRNIGASGGVGNVNVTTNANCNWTATSNAGFITIASGTSGSGAGSVTYSVAPNTGASSRSGTLSVAGQTFSLTQDGAGNPQPGNRVVRIGQAGGAPGGQVSVPIELVAQGDENALGFSLTFDPAVLSNPQAALGSDAAGATLNTNASQAGSGRLGIALSLQFGQKFSAGTRQIVVVTFAIASGASASSTQLGFSDQPIAREISDTNAGALQANYAPGAVALTSGFEADVAPRPNGNGTVTITDWVQIGRFVSGQDTPSGSEFQRADTAPRESRGNGGLTITDWVQAGRYVAGLDAPTPAGGPGSQGLMTGSRYAQADTASGSRIVRISSGYFERGQQSSVIIELGAEGNENALGFSLNFDPAQLRFVSAAVGRDASGATFNVNTSQTAKGRIGIALALPAGQTIRAGQRQIIVINFAVATEGEATTAAISFGDQPVTRELSDANANSLPVNFSSGAVTLTRSVTSVSAASFTGQSLASEAIVAAFGRNLATQLAVADALPLPTTLAGTTVKVRDGAGEERLAPLFFVAPTQVNYQIPAGAAAGEATVTITIGDGQVSTGTINIAAVAPGLFSAASSGQGVAAAVVLRVKADGAQSYESAARYDAAQNRFVALPIDLGEEGDQVFLILFGTGFRHQRDLAAVTVKLGDVETGALFAGPQDGFAGLDQLNLRIPRSLAGRGEVDVMLNVDGHEANRVKIHVK